AGGALPLFQKGDCDNPNAVPVGEVRAATHTPLSGCGIALKCAQTTAGITLTWTVTKPDCCAKFVISKDGAVIGSVPGGVASGSFPAPCLPGLYCVACVDAAGNVLSQDCCPIDRCPCTTPDPIGDVKCNLDPASNQVTITWSLVAGADP